MLFLVKLSLNNWEEVASIKIASEQEHFIPSALFSIAETQFYSSSDLLAIYEDETPIGLIMYEPDAEPNSIFIVRFIIDEQYQNMGYGRVSFELFLTHIRKNKIVSLITSSYITENYQAEKFFEKLGFEKTGDSYEGEQKVMKVINSNLN